MQRSAFDETMTPAEMGELQPHPEWDDGRKGCMYCRFDAVIDRERRLRAEITWLDNADEPENDNGSSASIFYRPELFLEANRPSEQEGEESLITWDCGFVKLTNAEAVALITSAPSEIVSKYAAEIATLQIWTPELGFDDKQSPLQKGTAT